MAGKKSAERESLWREIFKRQTESGLSVRKFCSSEGVSEPSFYAWRKKLSVADNGGAQPRTGARRKDPCDNGRLFVPLQVLDAAGTLEIVHPLGYRIAITGDVNPDTLRRVIETLDARGDR